MTQLKPLNKHEVLKFIEQEDGDERKEINRVLGEKWNNRTECFQMKTLVQFLRIASEYTRKSVQLSVKHFWSPKNCVSVHN